MIGGNIVATVQVKTPVGKNLIGENVEVWSSVGQVLGWLDFQSGENGVNSYNAKIQDTTHVFLCDFFRWKGAIGTSVTAENCRMVINGDNYLVLMIDNPMQMNQHLEINLKYIGGGLGV